jgi:hypothetical protein
MEKVSTPVDRHCDGKRTNKRNPAETENLASRPSHLDDPCQFGRERKFLRGTSRLDVMPPTIRPRGGSHRRLTLPRSETAWTMDVCTQDTEDLRNRESAPHDGCLPTGRGAPRRANPIPARTRRRANPIPAAPNRAISRPAASGPSPARGPASEQSGSCGSSRLWGARGLDRGRARFRTKRALRFVAVVMLAS